MDAPRTDSCSNRCALQIFFIPLSGENPESKANAIAFPQSVLSATLSKKVSTIFTKNTKRNRSEEDIPPNHLARVVNAAVNRLDDTIFDAAYPGGGRDSYHPKKATPQTFAPLIVSGPSE